MSNDTEQGKASPISVDIGAKATLEVKTEIPPESSGRFLDALTDIIRPFTEKRGLKADQLRLQREETLLEVARTARVRAQIDKIEPKALPTKFMVNFLEKASLENPESELVKKWSNLLVNASGGYSERFNVYLDILSNLTSKEARMLDNMLIHVRFTRSYLYRRYLETEGFRNKLAEVFSEFSGRDDFVAVNSQLTLTHEQSDRYDELRVQHSELGTRYEDREFRADVISPDEEVELKLAAIAPDKGALMLSIEYINETGTATTLSTAEYLDDIAEIANLERNNLISLEALPINPTISGRVPCIIKWGQMTPFGRFFVEACSDFK